MVPADELLPTAHALARDMVSCDQDTVRACKRLIEDGFALPLGEAMALEAQVNGTRRSRPGQIAERRAAVQQRGAGTSALGYAGLPARKRACTRP